MQSRPAVRCCSAHEPANPRTTNPGTTNPRTANPRTSNPRFAGAVIAISGFVALIYEVTWTRVLAMTLGPTTYAFSAMLVAFIAGLAIGSAIAARLMQRTH